MPSPFTGRASPLTREGIERAAALIDVSPATLWSVVTVETRGVGFMPDRRPYVLFERHIFSRRTNGRFDAASPDISGPPGGYGAYGAHQYDRLAAAIAHHREAALESASWGLGQIMGFNARAAGYASAEEMVARLLESEDEHLASTARFVAASNLHRPLQSRDWAGFARGYNGPGYAANRYDQKLADAYGRFSRDGLPDFTIRAVQLLLSYSGEDPGTIDGIQGARTVAAIERFKTKHGVRANTLNDLVSALVDSTGGQHAAATGPAAIVDGAPASPATVVSSTPPPSVNMLVLQRLLAALDFDPGPIDGHDGPRTRASLKEAIGDPVPSPANYRRLWSFFLSVVEQDSAVTRPRVALLQLLLARAGEQPGDVDGLTGPRTENAAAQFRQKHGIAQGPLISRPLFGALMQQV
jgi:peptidoglycan hydrolase-like protein with peptidoglycan-binding domain